MYIDFDDRYSSVNDSFDKGSRFDVRPGVNLLHAFDIASEADSPMDDTDAYLRDRFGSDSVDEIQNIPDFGKELGKRKKVSEIGWTGFDAASTLPVNNGYRKLAGLIDGYTPNYLYRSIGDIPINYAASVFYKPNQGRSRPSIITLPFMRIQSYNYGGEDDTDFLSSDITPESLAVLRYLVDASADPETGEVYNKNVAKYLDLAMKRNAHNIGRQKYLQSYFDKRHAPEMEDYWHDSIGEYIAPDISNDLADQAIAYDKEHADDNVSTDELNDALYKVYNIPGMTDLGGIAASIQRGPGND